MPTNKIPLDKNSVLRKLIKIFRSGNAVRHHFQGTGGQSPKGTAQAYFKNAYSYQSSATPGYADYSRFARYSDYAEMESYSILANALNIVADEVTQKNEKGKIIEVISDDEETENILQDLFDNVLKLNGKEIWKIVRRLLKYGDGFYLIDATEDNGVVCLIFMPPNEVEREEGFDEEEPGAIRFRWTSKQNVEIPNAYVLHFRLEGNEVFHPYGFSFVEPARRPWRQLVLLEDAMLCYRITRAPERRVFFLDMNGIPAENRKLAVETFNQELKKHHVVNSEGKIDLRYGTSLSIDEDYIIPVLGEGNTRIETLPGAQNLGDIEDVQYIEQKLFAALGIPKAYLTYEEGIAKNTLTVEDIRFARTISRIQEVVIAELVKVAMIHLYIKGKRGKDLVNFKIKMTNPSTVAELQKNELWRARMELVQSAGDGVFDTTFIYKNFLHLSDDAIDVIRRGQIQDKIFQAKLLAIETSSGTAPGGAMGGMGMGMGGGTFGTTSGFGGGFGGAPMNLSGLSPTGMGEGFNPELGKDLGRSSDGDSRKRKDRGVDEIGLSKEEDWADDDPAGIKDLKRSIALGEVKKEFDELIQEYRELSQKTEAIMKDSAVLHYVVVDAKQIKGINEEILKDVFGEDIGSTAQILHESLKNKVTEEEFSAKWESKLVELEGKTNAILEEFDTGVNKLLQEIKKQNK